MKPVGLEDIEELILKKELLVNDYESDPIRD